MKMMGYCTNLLEKLNRYIERENKAGRDIPRFTKSQIRLIVRYLERKEVFMFPHAIDCPGGAKCHCDEARLNEFRGAVRSMNRRLPASILEMLI